MFGGGYCVPIVEMDGRKIGNGTPGMVYQAIDNLLVEDMLSKSKRINSIRLNEL